MRHAVLILAILGSLVPGGLGLLWLSQQSKEKDTLKTNRETINKNLQMLPLAEVLDPGARSKVQKDVDDYNSQQDIVYRRGRAIPFLIGTAVLALLAGVLAELRRGFSAAALLVAAVAVPPVMYEHAGMLCVTGLLVVPAILALFVGPARATPPPRFGGPPDRRSRDEDERGERRYRDEDARGARRDRDEDERERGRPDEDEPESRRPRRPLRDEDRFREDDR
jgi:hypothetical protein